MHAAGLAPADKAASNRLVQICVDHHARGIVDIFAEELGGEIQLETRLRGDDPKRPSNYLLSSAPRSRNDKHTAQETMKFPDAIIVHRKTNPYLLLPGAGK
jgi:hypothetical protein